MQKQLDHLIRSQSERNVIDKSPFDLALNNPYPKQQLQNSFSLYDNVKHKLTTYANSKYFQLKQYSLKKFQADLGTTTFTTKIMDLGFDGKQFWDIPTANNALEVDYDLSFIDALLIPGFNPFSLGLNGLLLIYTLKKYGGREVLKQVVKYGVYAGLGMISLKMLYAAVAYKAFTAGYGIYTTYTKAHTSHENNYGDNSNIYKLKSYQTWANWGWFDTKDKSYDETTKALEKQIYIDCLYTENKALDIELRSPLFNCIKLTLEERCDLITKTIVAQQILPDDKLPDMQQSLTTCQDHIVANANLLSHSGDSILLNGDLQNLESEV